MSLPRFAEVLVAIGKPLAVGIGIVQGWPNFGCRSLTAALLTLVAILYNDVCNLLCARLSFRAGERIQMPNFVL